MFGHCCPILHVVQPSTPNVIAVVEWSEPPIRTGRGRDPRKSALFNNVVEALRAEPGKWAIVRTDCSEKGARPFKRRGCETSVRADGAGTFTVWARWPVSPPA